MNVAIRTPPSAGPDPRPATAAATMDRRTRAVIGQTTEGLRRIRPMTGLAAGGCPGRRGRPRGMGSRTRARNLTVRPVAPARPSATIGERGSSSVGRASAFQVSLCRARCSELRIPARFVRFEPKFGALADGAITGHPRMTHLGLPGGCPGRAAASLNLGSAPVSRWLHPIYPDRQPRVRHQMLSSRHLLQWRARPEVGPSVLATIPLGSGLISVTDRRGGRRCSPGQSRGVARKTA
jgi:hypothetical protein